MHFMTYHLTLLFIDNSSSYVVGNFILSSRFLPNNNNNPIHISYNTFKLPPIKNGYVYYKEVAGLPIK